MRIANSNIADKFKLKIKRLLLYDLGPKVYLAQGGHPHIWETVDTYVGQIGQYRYYRLIGSPLLYTLR